MTEKDDIEFWVDDYYFNLEWVDGFWLFGFKCNSIIDISHVRKFKTPDHAKEYLRTEFKNLADKLNRIVRDI